MNMPDPMPMQVGKIEEPFMAMISEIKLIGGLEGWGIYTSASRHVCYGRNMFKTYTETTNDNKVFLGRFSHH